MLVVGGQRRRECWGKDQTTSSMMWTIQNKQWNIVCNISVNRKLKCDWALQWANNSTSRGHHTLQLNDSIERANVMYTAFKLCATRELMSYIKFISIIDWCCKSLGLGRWLTCWFAWRDPEGWCRRVGEALFPGRYSHWWIDWLIEEPERSCNRVMQSCYMMSTIQHYIHWQVFKG